MALVSICIPSYKPEHFELCLTSAIAQSLRDIEIIVSDDCPGEGIKQICDRYPGKVTYSRNPTPGAPDNTRRVCRLATGKYIKFLFDDDVLHPFCVQYLVEAFEALKGHNPTLAFSPRDIIDRNNHVIASGDFFKVNRLTMIQGVQLIDIIASNLVNPVGEMSTVLFKRDDCFNNNGDLTLFLPNGREWNGLGDVAAWLYLAMRGNIIAYPTTLSYFRRDNNIVTNYTANPHHYYAITEWEMVISFAHENKYLDQTKAALAYQKLAHHYLHWSQIYPQLRDEAARIERLIVDLVPNAHVALD